MPTQALARAVAKAEALPLSDQDRVGRELERYVDSLAELRRKLDKGLESLDAGLGRELDMDAVIARANAQHGDS